MANQSGIASRNGSASRRRRCQCVARIGSVESSDASGGTNRSRERMDFMASSLDDESVAANARVWDFGMPPKSC